MWITTGHRSCKHQDRLKCYSYLLKWCRTIGICFALARFFCSWLIYFYIDNTALKRCNPLIWTSLSYWFPLAKIFSNYIPPSFAWWNNSINFQYFYVWFSWVFLFFFFLLFFNYENMNFFRCTLRIAADLWPLTRLVALIFHLKFF